MAPNTDPSSIDDIDALDAQAGMLLGISQAARARARVSDDPVRVEALEEQAWSNLDAAWALIQQIEKSRAENGG